MTSNPGWKIVVIDDEADIREVLAISLADAGYDVKTAADGEAGLRLCEECSPRIVITDIRMPRMDGIQVLEAVKNRSPDTEVIVATAFGEMELAIRALQLDASDFVTKPINDEALHLALKRARDRYTSRKQLKDYTGFLERERVETARELMRTFAFQKNLIENSMDGIIGCDASGAIVTFNRAIEKMLGRGREEVIGVMGLHRFFLPGEAKQLITSLSGEGHGGENRLFLYETRLVGKDGKQVPVQASGAVLFHGGVEEGRVFFFRDLREIRALEREVQDQARVLHQDKMMSLGRLAASVVHEINNPLTGILNYIRLMMRVLKRGPLDASRQEKFAGHLDLVEKETDRCSKIISGLLTFSRKSPPSMGDVNLEDLVNRCVLLSRHKLELSNIRLTVDIPPGVPGARGDYNQLQQCLINLIFNGIDAMPDGGQLHLSGGLDGPRGQVTLTVKDTGKGIREEDLPHVFEPFFTTKKEGYGVGLGLSTIYGIVQHHNGEIDVESQPGAGAAFTIRLPVSG